MHLANSACLVKYSLQKMNYKNFTDKEILESYSTSIGYSGKANKDLTAEVERRGGIDELKNKVAEQEIIPKEIARIKGQVFALYKTNQNPDKIKTSITSEILNDNQLNTVIVEAIQQATHFKKDTSINTRTIIGSIVGIVLSSLIGAGIWCYSIIQTGEMYYILTGGILIISYLIIKLLTRQSKNNVLVFVATFVSAFIAIPLGLWWYRLLTS